jgi:hypothetical protein
MPLMQQRLRAGEPAAVCSDDIPRWKREIPHAHYEYTMV